jgi:hypothetical protein
MKRGSFRLNCIVIILMMNRYIPVGEVVLGISFMVMRPVGKSRIKSCMLIIRLRLILILVVVALAISSRRAWWGGVR